MKCLWNRNRACLKTLLILMGALWLAGCPQGNVTVIPGDGNRNVPVNAAIRVRYQGPAHIRGGFLHPSNFQLTQCQSQAFNPTPPSTELSESEEEESSAIAQRSSEEDERVRTRLSVRRYQPKQITHEDGRTETFYFTDVVVIPQSTSLRETPLKAERTQYCFAFNDVKDETGRVYRGKRISFTTENEPSFYFAESTKVEWGHYAEFNTQGANSQLSFEDRILFKFDPPVFPGNVEAGTLACKTARETMSENDPNEKKEPTIIKNNSGTIIFEAAHQATTEKDPCEEYDQIRAAHVLYQVESFKPDKDSKFPIVRYDLYGVVGSPFEGGSQGESGPLHSVFPGLGRSRGHITNLHQRRFDFHINADLETSIERDVLKEMGREGAEFFSVTEMDESR